MRILQVISSIGPSYGGPSVSVAEISRHLALAGHDVTLAVTDADNLRNNDTPLTSDFMVPHFSLKVFPRWRTNRWQFSSGLCQWLWRNVAGFDLVHVHGLYSYAPLLSQYLAHQARIPCFITPHGMLNPVALRTGNFLKRLWFQAVEIPYLLRAAAIFVHNHLELDTLQRLELKVCGVVIPNGIRSDQKELPESTEEWEAKYPNTSGRQIIIAVGRLDPIKGLEDLIQAFARVKPMHRQTLLVLAGPDNHGYRQTLESLVQKMGLHQDILFTGYIEGGFKQACLSRANIFVQCSHSEGSSASILEALAMAKPCLITEGCNFPEAAEAGVVKMVPNSVSAIAEGLNEMLEDPDRYQDMGNRAKGWVYQNYTWDQIARKTLSLYANLLMPKA